MKVLKSIKHCIAAAVASLLVACGGSSLEENPDVHSVRLPNEISTGVEFTADLHKAQQLLQQGKRVVISVGYLTDGFYVLPTAEQMLQEKIWQYPDVFLRENLLVTVADELFWLDGKVVSNQEKRQRFDQVVLLIDLLRKYLPRAQLGMVYNPEAWQQDPVVWEYIGLSEHYVDWLATDIYFWKSDKPSIDLKLQSARDFANFVKIKRLLVLPGFAPADFPFDPSQWKEEHRLTLEYATNNLFNIAATQYDMSLIWGWDIRGNSDGLVFGNRWPESYRKIYLANLAKIV